MAATAGGYKFITHPISQHALPDQVSPVFPDRPIRPLPKRRIRSRLSLEQADSIVYPPLPQASSPLFTTPKSPSTRGVSNRYFDGELDGAVEDHDHDHEHVCGCGGDHSDLESEDEDEKASLAQRYSWPGRMMRLPRQQLEHGVNRNRVPLPNSSTSSADGYESFENSNNKKKRKIPVSGIMSSGGMDSIDSVAGSHSIDDGHGNLEQYYASSAVGGSSPHGAGMAGASRGRYARGTIRIPNERRPLTTSVNASNAYANSVNSKARREWIQTGGLTREYPVDQGIIANIASPKTPETEKGQENTNLAQRRSETGSLQKDFTFECKSSSSNKLGMPLQLPALSPSARPAPPGGNRRSAPPGVMPGTPNLVNGQMPRNVSQSRDAQYAPGHPLPPERKPRRRFDREYALAARQRRLQQEYNNYHHPPAREDIWVCAFCEYESIFGVPPTALIQQYERKDRKERKRIAEKKRLLEKAKAKGRKNKKGPKGTGKHMGAAMPAGSGAGQRGYDDHDDGLPPHDPDGQDDEFYDDGYDDTPPLPTPNVHHDINGAYGPDYPTPPGVPPLTAVAQQVDEALLARGRGVGPPHGA